MTQTITALFDKPADAQTAQSKLIAAGIPQSAIRLVAGSQTTRTTGSYDHHRDEGGFWASLKDIFMPEEDRYAYSEGLSRGGTMLTVSADEAHGETAYDILEEHGSVDLDERETAWRKEGWQGYGATSGAAATTAAAARTTGTATDKDYIPVVEETLAVGKRVVDQGRVRVRSYVVETPISEQVTLRNESVHVDRREVNRPVTVADEALFAEKTIEATERSEQAVVSKDARVVAEVGLRKEGSDRTETVTDKVRRTEVEVEDERGNISRTGTTGTTTDLPKR